RGAEGHDEGEDRRLRREPELPLTDEGQHAPLEPDHRPDQRIDADQQRELARVRPQAQPRTHARAAAVPRRFAATIAAWSAGGGGSPTSRPRATASASAWARARLCARSKPIAENGCEDSPRPQTEPP